MRAERAFIWNDSATTPSQACYPAPVRSPRRVRALGARLSPPPRPGEPGRSERVLTGDRKQSAPCDVRGSRPIPHLKEPETHRQRSPSTQARSRRLWGLRSIQFRWRQHGRRRHHGWSSSTPRSSDGSAQGSALERTDSPRPIPSWSASTLCSTGFGSGCRFRLVRPHTDDRQEPAQPEIARHEGVPNMTTITIQILEANGNSAPGKRRRRDPTATEL